MVKCFHTGLNELTECFTRKDNDLRGSKKEQAAKNSSWYGYVLLSRPNINEILENTSAYARIWDLYGYIINENQIFLTGSKSTKRTEAK